MKQISKPLESGPLDCGPPPRLHAVHMDHGTSNIFSLQIVPNRTLECQYEDQRTGHRSVDWMMVMKRMKVSVMTISWGSCGQWSRALGLCTTLKTHRRANRVEVFQTTMQSVVRWGTHELINTTMLWPYSRRGGAQLGHTYGLIGPF